MNIVKSKFCEHIKAVAYLGKEWLIAAYTSDIRIAYGLPVLINSFKCPICGEDCDLNYNKYQNLEKLPSGMQD